MSKEKENGVSNTKKSVDNSTDSSNNNNRNGHMILSPEALERYRKNKEFREKKQKFISLDTLYNNPTKFQFYPDKIEEVEVEYEGKVVSKIQYTVTEPDGAYPNMEKYLGLTSAKATELIDTKIFEEGQTLLKIWKKGQGKKTEYFVESAA
jgi:hypothetical protein